MHLPPGRVLGWPVILYIETYFGHEPSQRHQLGYIFDATAKSLLGSNIQRHRFPLCSYLFFMRRTSRLRVTSSVAPCVGRAGDEAMTTPGAMVLAGAARI